MGCGASGSSFQAFRERLGTAWQTASNALPNPLLAPSEPSGNDGLVEGRVIWHLGGRRIKSTSDFMLNSTQHNITFILSQETGELRSTITSQRGLSLLHWLRGPTKPCIAHGTAVAARPAAHRAWQVPMAAMATHNFSCVSFKTALSRSVSATTRRRMLQNPPRGLLLTWLEMKNLHPSSRNLASQ